MSESEVGKQASVNGTTYTIVDDYGSVYVVMRENEKGEQAYSVMTPGLYGKDPVLGDEPLGDLFPGCRIFGIPAFRSKVVYSHCHYSWWRHFLSVGIHYDKPPQRARAIANSAARKHVAQLDAAKIAAVIR